MIALIPRTGDLVTIPDLTDTRLEQTAMDLRRAGARFALVFGSVARGQAHSESDIDVAAWWPQNPPVSWEVSVPAGIDLTVISNLPLELAGRIAQEGEVLFEDDPAARVEWIATTRKIWLDEKYRYERSHQDFLESVTHGR